MECLHREADIFWRSPGRKFFAENARQHRFAVCCWALLPHWNKPNGGPISGSPDPTGLVPVGELTSELDDQSMTFDPYENTACLGPTAVIFSAELSGYLTRTTGLGCGRIASELVAHSVVETTEVVCFLATASNGLSLRLSCKTACLLACENGAILQTLPFQDAGNAVLT